MSGCTCEKCVGGPSKSVYVFTYPVLRGLSHECTLVTSGRRITLHGMPASTDKIIELGKLDDDGVPIVFVEWTPFEVFLNERGLQANVRLFLFAKINF